MRAALTPLAPLPSSRGGGATPPLTTGLWAAQRGKLCRPSDGPPAFRHRLPRLAFPCGFGPWTQGPAGWTPAAPLCTPSVSQRLPTSALQHYSTTAFAYSGLHRFGSCQFSAFCSFDSLLNNCRCALFYTGSRRSVKKNLEAATKRFASNKA